MKREQITVEPRILTGKHVRKLRREGIMPANISGKSIDSMAVQLPVKDFNELYKKVHETGVVDITVNGEKYPVLISRVQYNPLTLEPIHADFFNVNLKEKISATVAVVATGEAPAVVEKKGMVLELLTEVEVEALPTDLPEHIEVAIDGLLEVGDQITIADLSVADTVTIKTDPETALFRIGELVSKAAEEQEALEAAEADEQKAESAEGEAPTETTEPSETTEPTE